MDKRNDTLLMLVSLSFFVMLIFGISLISGCSPKTADSTDFSGVPEENAPAKEDSAKSSSDYDNLPKSLEDDMGDMNLSEDKGAD